MCAILDLVVPLLTTPSIESREMSMLDTAWPLPDTALIWTPFGASRWRERVGASSLTTQKDGVYNKIYDNKRMDNWCILHTYKVE